MAIGGEVEDYTIDIIGGMPPVANGDLGSNYTVSEDPASPLVITALGILGNDSDPDNDPIFVLDSDPTKSGIQPVSEPVNGTLTLNADGSFSYLPNPNFSGEDTFTYRAVDSRGLGSINPATVTINVTPINDRPEFSLPQANLALNEDQGADTQGNPSPLVYANFVTASDQGRRAPPANWDKSCPSSCWRSNLDCSRCNPASIKMELSLSHWPPTTTRPFSISMGAFRWF